MTDELRAEGLDTGLEATPLGEPEGYFTVRATSSLDQPACPFGSYREPCPSCGTRFARFGLFVMFEREALPTHWVYADFEGDARPMVSGEVARWLRQPGRGLLGEDDLDESSEQVGLDLYRRGLYPEAADIAFLPEHLRP
ncbi:MAG: hypothetical protein GXP62_05715 [Oligoflexia bacterium]|nr:hypothetical protein [Oligoflexia bacterium]